MDQGQSVHYRYKLNDKTCYNTIAVAGLMPDVVSALSEIDAIVSFYQARQGMEKNANDCATAIDTQLPSHKYNHGFIVREWGDNGYQRFLKEFAENVQPASNLDVLPKDYKRIEK